MSSTSQRVSAAHEGLAIYLVDVEHRLVNTIWMTQATTYAQFMDKLSRARLRQAARLFPHAVSEQGFIITPDDWHFRIVVKGTLDGGFADPGARWEPLKGEREFLALKQRLWARADIEAHFRLPVVVPRVVRQSEPPSSSAVAAAPARVDLSIWEQSNYPPLVINGANVRPEPESDKQ